MSYSADSSKAVLEREGEDGEAEGEEGGVLWKRISWPPWPACTKRVR